MQSALAAAATLVSLAFALSTAERWLASRRRHELAWTIALVMFSLASVCLWLGASSGWSAVLFRVFFLLGAVADVPVLALGTVYLLAGVRAGDRWAAAVAVFGAFSAGVVTAAPLVRAVPPHRLPQGSELFTALPRVLAAVGSGAGATVVFAGAAWSARRHRRGRLAGANLLIAAGTLLLSGSGLLNSVLGEMEGFAVVLVLGISVIFAGFLLAVGPAPPHSGSEAPSRPVPRTALHVQVGGERADTGDG